MDENNYLTRKIDALVPYIADKHFAIYPCGERGSFIRDYLENKYQLSADFLIDNYKAQESKKYIRIDELNDLGNSKLIIVLASDSKRYYKEIRKEIRKYVPHTNIIDLFPQEAMCTGSKTGRIFWEKLLYPHGKISFLRSIKNSKKIKLLDVGCGNRSPQNVKAILNKIYYVGIDVGDYNQTLDSKGCADEYHIG